MALIPGAAFAQTGFGNNTQLAQPKLQIPIPELTFSTSKFVGDKIQSPYLAQYIAGIYRFLLSIVGVVAAVSMIYGGFLWMTSGGAADRAKAGQKRIADSIIGLVLAFGSYLILYLINPATVNFTSFGLIALQPEIYETLDDNTPEVPDPNAPQYVPSNPAAYDSIFQKYAPCAGIDWNALKAVATKESGLNTNLVNRSGYIGLFQTKPANCQGALRGYDLAAQCNDLTNPRVNTAVGAMMMKKAIKIIQGKCPNAQLLDQFTMIYINHNMGSGMLSYAAGKSCDAAGLRKAVIDYYAGPGATTAKSYADKYQKDCLSSGKTAAECTGGPKFDFAQKTAQTMSQLGVTALVAPTTADCPIQ